MSTATENQTHDIETGTLGVDVTKVPENGTRTLFDNSLTQYLTRTPVHIIGALTDVDLLTNRSMCRVCNSKIHGGTCEKGHTGAWCMACKKYIVYGACPDGCNAFEEVD